MDGVTLVLDDVWTPETTHLGDDNETLVEKHWNASKL